VAVARGSAQATGSKGDRSGKRNKEEECSEPKGQLGGGAVDQSRPMLALITLFVKYNDGTNIQQVAAFVRTIL
jgi:hypothetical protein